MADGVVSAVVETILGILSSAALQQIGLLWGLKDELNGLESTFGTVQLVLQDAELKQKKNEAIQNWLRKLKNAAYDAENILDRIATKALRRRVDSERGMQHQLKSFLSLRNPLLFRFKMVREVRNIRGKLDAIAEERHKFHLGEGVVENRFGETLESRHTSSLVSESEICGRQEEKEMIIETLLNGMSDQDDLSVYAIWGMGGLGKTTLAQIVYNDERTKSHFELRIWVCVSNDFDVRRLVRAMIESIEGHECNISELDPLQRHFQEKLRGRRFLLVLDDVWNEDDMLWDKLKEVVRCGSKGSMLMVTTRIEKIATMMANINKHHIGYLSEDDSWSLFRQKAFTNGDGEENFVAIGKMIVEKCGGVPLAVKALGSLMRSKSHENEWLAIKESEIWSLSDAENGILPALRLSYHNLLPQMRQCFAYCCIYPKDSVMGEDELIQLWMANGYLPSDGQMDLHLTGHLIFKELVWRSFLQDVETDYMGYVTCKMHDLMHDLALSVMRHESYILEHGKVPKIPKTLRHLYFNSRMSREVPENKSKLELSIDNSLRSIIVLGGSVPACQGGFSSFLSKKKYLRALDVRRCVIEKLPKSVCKLEHLRFLAMGCSNMKRLPESLTRLLNLQTLKLTYSSKVLELPKGLKVMKNLWFVDIERFDSLLCTPPGLGDLTCLRRLSIFIVGQDASHQINQLKELNLGGRLSIEGLGNVRNLEDAKSANLMTKKNLTSLSLSWEKSIEENSAEHFEQVLEGLQPHHNLEEIRIRSYQGLRFSSWVSTLAFEKLKELSLENCPRCEHLPPLGKLRSLTSLILRRMDSVRCLDAASYGDGEISFPSLTSLTMTSMPNFEEWTVADSVESFPCLKNLEIQGCPKLTGLPKLPTLRRLYIAGSKDGSPPEMDVFQEDLLQNHKALEHLMIIFLPIRTPPNMLDNLSALKTLYFNGCSNLEFLSEGLKLPTSLEILKFFNCDGFRSFSATILEGLSSLRSLSFHVCKKLKPLSGPLNGAIALQELELHGLPELECLPESLQLASALGELNISSCKRLYSLPNWLGSLQSLSAIEISNCQNFNSLPDSFVSLKSLRSFSISGCPQLEKRCEKQKGEDWPKISHIPNISINWMTIQLLDHE